MGAVAKARIDTRKGGRHRKPGPFSRDELLTVLDNRTRTGRLMKGVIKQLSEQIGAPTTAQALLINQQR